MKQLLYIGFFISLLFFTSCSKVMEIPEDKREYIGTWSNEYVTLTISEDGYIDYTKEKESLTSSFSGPIKELNDNAIKSGIGFISKTFEIQKAPYREGMNIYAEIETELLVKEFSLKDFGISSNEDLISIVKNDIKLFHYGILKSDMKKFYNNLSEMWREDMSLQKVEKIFFESISKGMVAKANEEDIHIEKISINNNRALLLEGSINGNVEVVFQLVYIYEVSQWKLATMNIEYNF